MEKVALISTGMAGFLYAATCIVGVLAFGVGQQQPDSLVTALPEPTNHALDIVAFAGVMLSVLTCFQFHIFPIRQFIAYTIRKVRCRTADEKDDIEYWGISLTRWFDIIAALSVVALIVLIAVVLTSITTILDFVGAFASSFIAFVAPALWILQLRRKQRLSGRWPKLELIVSLSVLLVGLFFVVFGTYSAFATTTK
jgi:amino acid permease